VFSSLGKTNKGPRVYRNIGAAI